MQYCEQAGSQGETTAPFCLEAVIVCDNYGDFLAQTLPHNKSLFNKIVVATSYEDKKTQKVCEFYHVECVRTDELQSRKGEFWKAKGINAAIGKLEQSVWVIHLDADIWLPPQTRLLLERAGLDKSMIYGADRFIVKGPAAWHGFLEAPKLQQENDSWIHMGAFPVGTRVMQALGAGYIPIGFFQLWHPKASGVNKYPENHSDAGRTDVLFAELWPRSKRALIPEVVAYHLESDDAGFGTNWQGRKSSPFTIT